MSRLIAFWMDLKPFALIEPCKHSPMWDQDGQVVTMPIPRSGLTHAVPLAEFRQGVIAEMAELQRLIVEQAPCIDFATFRLSGLVDDPDAKLSPFSQPANMEYFKPFVDTIWACMQGNSTGTACCAKNSHRTSVVSVGGKFQKAKAKAWLKRSQAILELILVLFVKTGGIPPRAWQACALLFQGHGGFSHNVHLIRHGGVLLARPLAKQDGKLVFDAFWSLPRQLGVILTFFLGVIRVIELKLLRRLGWPTEWHRRHIFVRNSAPKASGKSPVFDAESLNARLRKSTPDYPLGIMEYRKLMQSIFDTHFSPLYAKTLEAIEQASKDSETQGQHTRGVVDRWYGLDEIAKATGLSRSQRNTHFATSDVFHTWYGFVDDVPSWMQPADMPAMMGDTRSMISAMQVARLGVIEDYPLVHDHKKAKKEVARLMSLKPFLHGPRVRHRLKFPPSCVFY